MNSTASIDTILNPERIALNDAAYRRAVLQLAEYEVTPTETPGLFRIARNGAAYLTTANTCTCEHWQRRVSLVPGALCKHVVRVRAHIEVQAERDAAARSARARKDRDNW